MLMSKALLTSGNLKAISVRILTDFLAISISTSEAQSLSSLSRSPRLYSLANSPRILTLSPLMYEGQSNLQQKYLKSFSKYCLPPMWRMTYSICCRTMYMVSQDPEFQLPLMRVMRGALIFSTMLRNISSFRSVSLRMILMDPSTRGVEECFSFSHSTPMIQQRYLSLFLSGVQRQRMSKMQVCCHSLYSLRRLMRQKYSLLFKGTPPSETRISSRASRALTETKPSESLMSCDSELMMLSSRMMVAGSTQKTFRTPMMAVFFTQGSKSLRSSRTTGRTLLTQSEDLKEQRLRRARPRILEEECLQSFLKVLTAMMARSGLSSAQVVRQKQIIFFMTSSLVKLALHISEKTGEASIPRVIQPMTLRITSLPFLLSFSLMTPLSALTQGTAYFLSSFISPFFFSSKYCAGLPLMALATFAVISIQIYQMLIINQAWRRVLPKAIRVFCSPICVFQSEGELSSAERQAGESVKGSERTSESNCQLMFWFSFEAKRARLEPRRSTSMKVMKAIVLCSQAREILRWKLARSLPMREEYIVRQGQWRLKQVVNSRMGAANSPCAKTMRLYWQQSCCSLPRSECLLEGDGPCSLLSKTMASFLRYCPQGCRSFFSKYISNLLVVLGADMALSASTMRSKMASSLITCRS